MRKQHAAAIAPAIIAAMGCLVAGQTAQAGIVTDWNLVVRKDLYNTSQVQGSVLVGGSVRGTSNYGTKSVTSSIGDSLVVGGDLKSGFNYQINSGGSLRIGGTKSGNVNLNGGGKIVYDTGISSMINDVFADVQSVGAYLQTLSANGTLGSGGSLTATPTLHDGNLVAVYNLTAASIRNYGQLSLNIGNAKSVVINVAADANGVVDLSAPPNMLGDFNANNANRIVWNLYNATTVKVNTNLCGAVFAPYADLKLAGGYINGTVVVDSVSQMSAEIRSSAYTGYVPEPATALLTVLAGPMLLRRRRA